MLIKCDECGKEISNKARTCPNCGYPIDERNNVRKEKDFKEKHTFAWVISVITLMCACAYSQYIGAMIFYLFAAVLVNPLFLEFMKNKGIKINKILQVILWFVIVGFAANFLPESEIIENKSNNVKIEQIENEIIEENSLKEKEIIDTSETKNNVEINNEIKNDDEDPLYNFDVEEDIKVFVETYYNNELDGNKKYFGKRVKIKGTLNNIETDDSVFFNMGTTCYLKTNKHYDVACNFLDGNAKGLSEHSRNKDITIIGEVDTLRDAYPKDVIYLKKCVVVME